MVELRWHAAQVVAGQDATLRFYIDRLGFQVFLPRVVEHRTSIRLYPGYAFLRFSEDDEWERINNTPGVVKLLPVNRDRPSPLPVGFVEELQHEIEAGAFTPRQAEDLVAKYQPGRVVDIISGPYTSFTGELVRHKRGALILLVSLFGKQFEQTFARHQVA